MKTRIATALSTGTSTEAADALSAAIHAQLQGQAPAFVLVFASAAQPLPILLPALKERLGAAVVLGASSSGEFTEQGEAKGATSVFAVAGDYRVFAGVSSGLREDVRGTVTRAMQDLPRAVEQYPYRTAVLLLDPLAGRSDEAVNLAAMLLGNDVRLAGGAAGDDLQMKATYVGCDASAVTDGLAMAFIFSKLPLGVGVCHGHLPISGSLTVTRATGSVVYEIDGQPAWDVWVEQTRPSTLEHGLDPRTLKPDEIAGFLLRYEAGIAVGKQYKIRAPLSRGPDGSLSFACGIPQGSTIHITESEAGLQITSAREAAYRARMQLGDNIAAGAVVFDCICRKLILGKDFNRAVQEIHAELGQVPLAGFETYGEIALDAGDLSGFHNTTTVVLAFPR